MFKLVQSRIHRSRGMASACLKQPGHAHSCIAGAGWDQNEPLHADNLSGRMHLTNETIWLKLILICNCLQLDHEMSMQNNMSYSMMNGQSPQTPQEDYQDPKNRYSCICVPSAIAPALCRAALTTLQLTMLHAGPASR